ncbi:MAG: hypothetical protein P8X85_13460 [Desulfobacterales bacterium]
MPENSHSDQFENIIINEAQLILAEKRTSLAVLRTGIAVFVLPLSVVSLLIVTSKYYDIIHVMHLFLPLMILCTILAVLGGYLIIRSILRILHHDRIIKNLKRQHSLIAELID